MTVTNDVIAGRFAEFGEDDWDAYAAPCDRLMAFALKLIEERIEAEPENFGGRHIDNEEKQLGALSLLSGAAERLRRRIDDPTLPMPSAAE